MISIIIPGTYLCLTLKDPGLQTLEVRYWLEGCAEALAPEVRTFLDEADLQDLIRKE
jgi:hypothetical protein